MKLLVILFVLKINNVSMTKNTVKTASQLRALRGS